MRVDRAAALPGRGMRRAASGQAMFEPRHRLLAKVLVLSDRALEIMGHRRGPSPLPLKMDLDGRLVERNARRRLLRHFNSHSRIRSWSEAGHGIICLGGSQPHDTKKTFFPS